MWIIITGNPVDGFEYHGPFDTNESACEFGNGDEHMTDHGGDWWVAEIQAVQS